MKRKTRLTIVTSERDAYRAQVAKLSAKIATAEKREAQSDAEIALAEKYFAALESLK